MQEPKSLSKQLSFVTTTHTCREPPPVDRSSSSSSSSSSSCSAIILIPAGVSRKGVLIRSAVEQRHSSVALSAPRLFWPSRALVALFVCQTRALVNYLACCCTTIILYIRFSFLCCAKFFFHFVFDTFSLSSLFSTCPFALNVVHVVHQLLRILCESV